MRTIKVIQVTQKLKQARNKHYARLHSEGDVSFDTGYQIYDVR